MFERVLLAVDASDCSRRAVTTAAELAGKVGAEVIVLHVFEVAPVPLGVGVEPMVIMPEAKDVAHELVAEAVAELRRAGVTARGEVSDTRATTARQIVDGARSSGADLVVMGSRGPSDLGGLLLGSTAHKVIHLAECPVLVVR
jgi:nucleotide-binding universal stress UspA family protein